MAKAKKNKKRWPQEYPFVLSYDPHENIYIARAVDLPNCHTDGSSPEEAVKNIYEAIQGWLETARKNGIPIPEPSHFRERPKKFLLRLEPHNVVKLETLASSTRKSLNHLINEAISSF